MNPNKDFIRHFDTPGKYPFRPRAFHIRTHFGCTLLFPMSDPIVHVRRLVHQDDLHVLRETQNHLIISGSKDCSVKAWEYCDQTVSSFEEKSCVSTGQISYEQWVTALEVYHDFCIFGTRNGQLVKWDPVSGAVLKETSIPSFRRNLNCKDRNSSRVCCLHSIMGELLIGVPGKILCYEEETMKPLKRTINVHSNDWVYCIRAIQDRTAVVVGEKLHLYTPGFRVKFEFDNTVVTESTNRLNRPKISSLEVISDTEMLASCFDGTVRIFDVDHDSPTILNGHVGRVWNSIAFEGSNKVMLSCADDGKIKLWDVRVDDPCVWTSITHCGRVNALLVSNDSLLSSTCHAKPHYSDDKCCFYWRDIRMLSQNIPS